MAQSVERVLGKDEVGGSNPPSSSKQKIAECLYFKGFPRFLLSKKFYLKNCSKPKKTLKIALKICKWHTNGTRKVKWHTAFSDFIRNNTSNGTRFNLKKNSCIVFISTQLFFFYWRFSLIKPPFLLGVDKNALAK